MGKRENWIDIFKGIGIILVIAGHFVDYNSVFTRYIFTFHMPLFFFASGCLYRKVKYHSELQLARARTKKLLLPYLAFCLAGLIFTAILHAMGLKFPGIPQILYEVFIKGQPGSLIASHLWFLVCLFVTELLFGAMLLHIRNPGNIILAIILCVIAEQVFNRLFGLELPWKMNSALIAVVFYGAGYALKGGITMVKSKFNHTTALILAILFLCGLLFGVMLNHDVNMANAEYHHIMLFFIAAFAGIFLVAYLSRIIHRNRILEFLGRNSFIIFTTHYFIMYILVYLISLIRQTPFTLYSLSVGIGLLATMITLLLEIPVVIIYNKLLRIISR